MSELLDGIGNNIAGINFAKFLSLGKTRSWPSGYIMHPEVWAMINRERMRPVRKAIKEFIDRKDTFDYYYPTIRL